MTPVVNPPNFQILMVEDNAADIELVKLILFQIDDQILFTSIADGAEASDFLFRRGTFASSVIVPDLILLDLNIPKRDGRSLLREIKGDRDLGKIPVVMLSTSSSDREVSDSYCLGASAFISKPLNLSDFQNTLEGLVNFYFRIARLATRPGKR